MIKLRYEIKNNRIYDNEVDDFVDDVVDRLNIQDFNKNELINIKQQQYQRIIELSKTNKFLSNELTKNNTVKQDHIETCCGIPIFEIPKLKQDNEELKQKLAEYEKENRELHTTINLSIPNQIAMKDEIEKLHTCRDKRIDELVTENNKLEQQLADAEKEITNYQHELEVYKHNDNIYASKIGKFANKAKQDKVEFAIKQLEKVKDILPEENVPIYPITILKQIINQIKQLKEGKCSK